MECGNIPDSSYENCEACGGMENQDGCNGDCEWSDFGNQIGKCVDKSNLVCLSRIIHEKMYIIDKFIISF